MNPHARVKGPLSDVTHLRTWKYVVRRRDGSRHGPYYLHQDLVGAAVGDQPRAHISFRAALHVIEGFNHIAGETSSFAIKRPFRLLLPNPSYE